MTDRLIIFTFLVCIVLFLTDWAHPKEWTWRLKWWLAAGLFIAAFWSAVVYFGLMFIHCLTNP
jgi:hypothetical protein